MQEEINSIGKKATKIAKNLINKAESVGEDTTGQVRQAATDVTETATDYLANFNSSPLAFVRQYPMQAAVGGLILGFLLGSAVAKKSVTE